MTARELGAEYVAIGRALEKLMPDVQIADHGPTLDGQAAVGAAASCATSAIC